MKSANMYIRIVTKAMMKSPPFALATASLSNEGASATANPFTFAAVSGSGFSFSSNITTSSSAFGVVTGSTAAKKKSSKTIDSTKHKLGPGKVHPAQQQPPLSSFSFNAAVGSQPFAFKPARLIDRIRPQVEFGAIFDFGKLQSLMLEKEPTGEVTELFAYLMESGASISELWPITLSSLSRLDLLLKFIDAHAPVDGVLFGQSIFQTCTSVKLLLDLGVYLSKKQIAFFPYKNDSYSMDLLRLFIDREGEVDSLLFSRACLTILDDDLTLVQYLLQLGARVNAIDEYFPTPINIAIKTSNAKLFDLLVTHGAIPPAKQILMHRIGSKAHNLNIIDTIFLSYVTTEKIAIADNLCALRYLYETGHCVLMLWDCLPQCLPANLIWNSRLWMDCMLEMDYNFNNDITFVRTLLIPTDSTATAASNDKDFISYTDLFLKLARQGCSERFTSIEEFYHVIQKSHLHGLTVLEYLLQNGRSPFECIHRSHSALRVIIQQTSNKIEILQLLLVLGFDLNEPDVFGYDALSYSCEMCSRDVARWLLETARVSPDNNRRKVELWSPLSNLAFSNFPLLIHVLLDCGADVNARSGVGQLSALHVAVAARHFATTKVFIDRGANVNAINALGETPLMMLASVKGGNDGFACALLLINAGVDVNQLNAQGLSPLALALQEDNDRLAEAFFAAGAAVSPAWLDENSPSHLRLSANSRRCLKKIIEAQPIPPTI